MVSARVATLLVVGLGAVVFPSEMPDGLLADAGIVALVFCIVGVIVVLGFRLMVTTNEIIS